MMTLTDTSLPLDPFADPLLLDRYLAGEVTADERVLFDRVLANPQGRVLFDKAVEVRGALQMGIPARTRAETLASIRARAQYGQARAATPNVAEAWTKKTALRQPVASRVLPRQISAQWLKTVGLWVAMVVAVPMLWTGYHRVAAPRSETGMKEYRTVAGQRARLTLPDSSTIILAPQSRVRYAADFGTTSNRTVVLDGQALFTVTHSAGAPFIVRAGSVATHVLGTSFAVRRYATDTAVRVIVAEGRVSVGSAVLTTGDVALATDTQVAVSRSTAVGEQLGWTNDRLVFSHVLLRDVIPELERWYGITIDVADPVLLDRLVVATLDRVTAREAVELIAYAVKGQATTTGTHTVIHHREPR